jgi:CheY-like chemotaxis protein
MEMVAARLHPDQTRLSRHTDAAMQGVRQAAQLTKRLLAFSRRPVPEPEAVDVDRLVSGLAELLRRTTGSRIGLEVRLSGSPLFVWADVNQMENALLSLVLSAREQVPDGGALTLTVSAVRTAQPPADHMQIELGGLSRVRDWGADLFMARAFARQAGGTLTHNPTPRLLLPRHLPPRARARERQPGGPTRVLVVEDDDALRSLCAETLRGAGFAVLEAPDAMEAFGLLTDHGGTDLLFVDIGLPGGVGGQALAHAARDMDATVRVLFTTGQDNPGLPQDAALLRKPFRPADLLAAVRETLGRSARPSAITATLLANVPGAGTGAAV